MTAGQTRDALAGKHILLVEDMGLVAHELQLMLTRFGCTVAGPVPDLDSGIEAARSDEKFDAAILDVNLAGDDSYPIAQALDERQIPFLLTTGYGVGSLRDEFKNAAVITKPFTADQFANKLELLFADHAVQHAEAQANAQRPPR